MSGHGGCGHYVLENVGDFKGMSHIVCSWKKVRMFLWELQRMKD
jgi:hypothetical protein